MKTKIGLTNQRKANLRFRRRRQSAGNTPLTATSAEVVQRSPDSVNAAKKYVCIAHLSGCHFTDFGNVRRLAIGRKHHHACSLRSSSSCRPIWLTFINWSPARQPDSNPVGLWSNDDGEISCCFFGKFSLSLPSERLISPQAATLDGSSCDKSNRA